MIDDFATDVPPPVLDRIQDGVLKTRYRGVAFLKSPFDIGLYMQLIGRLQPQTVIEIGTKEGGSALWFADMLTLHGTAARIVSIDVESVPEITDKRIIFLSGNALHLEDALKPELLDSLPRPWLVVEDSAHKYETSIAVLRFFNAHMRRGDYIVIEDGVVSSLTAPVYRKFMNGPNRAVAEFLAAHEDAYGVDTALCNFYGRNATYNPNAWLFRRKREEFAT